MFVMRISVVLVFLLFLPGTAMAQQHGRISPAGYYIGMDYQADQAEFIPAMEGEALTSIDVPWGGEASQSSNVNFNLAFLPGTTRFSMRFRMLSDPENPLTPMVRLRFHYWPEDLWVQSFKDTELGYATDVTFRLAVNDEGEEYIAVTEDVQGMEYMTARPMRLISGPLKPREWNEVEIELINQFDLAMPAWRSGVQLEASEDTRRAVEEGFRRLYTALSNGRETTYEFYRSQMENNGKSYGITGREWFQETFLSLAGSENFELLPYDSSNSELLIAGYGRLATLHLLPIEAKLYGEEYISPTVYFWKDAQGNWHPRD